MPKGYVHDDEDHDGDDGNNNNNNEVRNDIKTTIEKKQDFLDRVKSGLASRNLGGRTEQVGERNYKEDYKSDWKPRIARGNEIEVSKKQDTETSPSELKFRKVTAREKYEGKVSMPQTYNNERFAKNKFIKKPTGLDRIKEQFAGVHKRLSAETKSRFAPTLEQRRAAAEKRLPVVKTEAQIAEYEYKIRNYKARQKALGGGMGIGQGLDNLADMMGYGPRAGRGGKRQNQDPFGFFSMSQGRPMLGMGGGGARIGGQTGLNKGFASMMGFGGSNPNAGAGIGGQSDPLNFYFGARQNNNNKRNNNVYDPVGFFF